VLDERGFWASVTLGGEEAPFNESCPGDEAYGFPVGQLSGGGECDPALFVRMCSAPNPPAVGMSVSLSTPLTVVGTSPATAYYRGMQLDAVEVTVDEIGEVTEPIRGSFVGVASIPDGMPTDVTGQFVVCRIPDMPPCP
jgi:hypothetical protein